MRKNNFLTNKSQNILKLAQEEKMNVMLEKTLATGEKLRILRFVTPEEFPERVVRYWIASFGFDSWREAVFSLTYWRLYFREVFAGNFAKETVDHLYIAEVNGEYAARMWFAYSKIHTVLTRQATVPQTMDLSQQKTKLYTNAELGISMTVPFQWDIVSKDPLLSSHLVLHRQGIFL